MRPLFIAVYAEGETDERFLPVLIRRVVVHKLADHATEEVEVMPPVAIDDGIRADSTRPRQADKVLEAARHAANYEILIVHADADDRNPDKALAERYDPGRELVEAAMQADERVCDRLVPIIPVRMTEAWMLADPQALQAAIGAGLGSDELQLLDDPRSVEKIPDPKQYLERVIRSALGGRRRARVSVADLYAPLGTRIRLDRLEGVPAYRRFVSDLADGLASMGLVG